jgi:hypothetical protein
MVTELPHGPYGCAPNAATGSGARKRWPDAPYRLPYARARGGG